jgi:type II secretory pathway pseudopilin PulG
MVVRAASQRTVCDMHSAPADPRSPRRSRRESGFSLLELLVAILLVDVAILGIVHTHAIVVRNRNEMRARSAAVTAAAARIERILASPCTAGSGSSVLSTLAESWASSLDGQTREISDSIEFGASAPHVVVLRTRFPC